MSNRRWVVAATAAILIVLAGLIPDWKSNPAVVSAHVVAKKTCKTVKKHGKAKRVCTKKTPTPVPSPTSSPTATVIPTNTPIPVKTGPSPLAVQLQLDVAHRVSQTLSIDGGTVVATDARGTRYTLTVPRDALLAATQISLTPISALTGLSLSGGLAAAVQIEPDAQLLFRPATLTVELAQPVPLDAQIPFAFRGSGDSVHLYSLSRDRSTITFTVYRLQGFGLGSGTAQDIAAIAAHAPATTLEQDEQQIAILLLPYRRQNVDVADAVYRQAVDLLTRYYNQEILPYYAVAQASDEEAAALEFYGNAFETLDEIRALGGSTTLQPALMSSWTKSAKHQYDRYEGLCRGHQGAVAYLGPGIGWTMADDVQNASRRVAYARLMGTTGGTMPSLDDALAPCRPAGFQFPSIQVRIDFKDPKTSAITAHADVTITGHVCGPTPYGVPWTVSEQWTLRTSGSQGSTTSGSQTEAWTFLETGASQASLVTGNGTLNGVLSLATTPSPAVKVIWPGSTSIVFSPATLSPAVTQDTADCPGH